MKTIFEKGDAVLVKVVQLYPEKYRFSPPYKTEILECVVNKTVFSRISEDEVDVYYECLHPSFGMKIFTSDLVYTMDNSEVVTELRVQRQPTFQAPDIKVMLDEFLEKELSTEDVVDDRRAAKQLHDENIQHIKDCIELHGCPTFLEEHKEFLKENKVDSCL